MSEPQQAQQQQHDWSQEEQHFMWQALQQAELADAEQEVPVGVVFVRDNQVVATGHNRTNATRNGTRHAEMEAIDYLLEQHGGSSDAVKFYELEVYVTCEPCIMCAGALALLHVKRVVYGCRNDKFGGAGSVWNVARDGCGGCGGADSAQGAAQLKEQHGVHRPVGFDCKGGLFAEEAVELLRRFYVSGNPMAPDACPHAAPKPHRAVQRRTQLPAGTPGAGITGPKTQAAEIQGAKTQGAETHGTGTSGAEGTAPSTSSALPGDAADSHRHPNPTTS